jgi:hypothetical protein
MKSNEGAQGGSVTGHSRMDVEAILDAHYLGMTTKARRVRLARLERAAAGNGNRWRTKIAKQSDRSRCDLG